MKIIQKAAESLVALVLSAALLAGSLTAAACVSPEVSGFLQDTYGLTVPVQSSAVSAVLDSCSDLWEGVLSLAGVTQSATAEELAAELGISMDSTYYPYYGMLDAQGQAAYLLLYSAFLSCSDTVSFGDGGITEEQYCSAWEAVYKDHAELFWVAGECSYSMDGDGRVISAQPGYYEFGEGLEAARQEFGAAAQAVTAQAMQLETDYEKEVFIHDALAAMAVYDSDSSRDQSAYSVLVSGRSVCAGYARAFQYLMTECGIPCYYCTGDCGGDHAWNIVMLDGGYYNVDLTWDDASGSYSYFNRSDEDFAATHVRSGMSLMLPACCADKYRNTSPMPGDRKPDYSGGGRGGIEGEAPSYQSAYRREGETAQGQPQNYSGRN